MGRQSVRLQITSQNRQGTKDQGPTGPFSRSKELRAGQEEHVIGVIATNGLQICKGGRRQLVTPSLQCLVLPLSRLLPHHKQVRHGAACTEQEPLTTTDLIVIIANSLTETVRSAAEVRAHYCARCNLMWQPSVARTDWHFY